MKYIVGVLFAVIGFKIGITFVPHDLDKEELFRQAIIYGAVGAIFFGVLGAMLTEKISALAREKEKEGGIFYALGKMIGKKK